MDLERHIKANNFPSAESDLESNKDIKSSAVLESDQENSHSPKSRM